MKLQTIPCLLLIALLVGCEQAHTNAPQTGSGEALETASASSENIANSQFSSTELRSSSTPSQQEEIVPPEMALEMMYEDATAVHGLVTSVWPDLSTEEQQILSPVISVFSQDIEVLGYYLEVSQYEPLSDEDLEILLPIMMDIENAMELLAQAIEQLL